MARSPRESVPGRIYHVFQRGNNKEFIFSDDDDKLSILFLLEEHARKQDFELLGFVIMGNHYHLILRLKETPMQKYMHRILSIYATLYNKRKNRSGHVFENRYNSIAVRDKNHLLDLLRYVHQNPVRAGLCERVNDYKWSTDRFYRSQKYLGLVNTSFILNYLSENRLDAIKMYDSLMNKTVNKGKDYFESASYTIARNKSLNELLWECCQDASLCKNIENGMRSPALTSYKRQFASAAGKAGYSMTEIGRYIGISQSGISRLLKSKDC